MCLIKKRLIKTKEILYMPAIQLVNNNSINRKIFLYEIRGRQKGIEDDQEFHYTQQLFQLMQQLGKSLEYNNTADNRWYAVESIMLQGDVIKGILACCKYNYRPNLINVQNKTERISPKSNTEGDKEKTHFVIKNGVIAYEQRRNGTGISVFSKLMNEAWKRIRNEVDSTITSIVLHQIIDTNFLEIIKKANKIKNAKFVVNSHLIGSEFFNFSNDNGVEDSYVLEVKAKRRHSLDKTNFIEKIERILASDELVDKVTVSLNDEDDNPRIINTEEFSKQFNICLAKNDIGEVVDEDIFQKLSELI